MIKAILVLVDKGGIKHITDEEVLTNSFVVLYVDCYVPNQVHILLYLQDEPVLNSFKFVSPLFWVISKIFST